MHHKVGFRQFGIDRLDRVHRQNVTIRFAGKLIRAVAGATGNRQGITFGFLYEINGLIGVCQQLIL